MTEALSSPETREKKPGYVFTITRHAERLPSGVLSPEGKANAGRKGEAMQGEAEVLKFYASDHPSGRAFDTGNLVTEAGGIKSLRTGETYKTRKVEGIQYDILKPDLLYLLGDLKGLIDEATLTEAGLSTERDEKGKLKIDIDKLPIPKQEELAPLRAKNQKLGFDAFMQKPEAVHRLAIGLAHELVRELKIAGRYDRARKEKTPLTKNVVIGPQTHGLFVESLLWEVGVHVDKNGTKTEGVDLAKDFGGYIQPLESISLRMKDPAHPPEKIPVSFENKGRPTEGVISIDFKKLEALSREYTEWKKARE